MATLTVYAEPGDDGSILSSDVVYATMAAGAALYAETDAITYLVGQGTQYDNGLAYIRWNASALGAGATINSAVVSFHGNDGQFCLIPITHNLRAFEWGTLTTADWRTPSQLAALPLLAHAAVSSETTTYAYTDFANDDLAANINKTGYTYVVMSSNRFEAGNVPTGSEKYEWYSADIGGTTYPPKLTIDYTPAPALHSLLMKGATTPA